MNYVTSVYPSKYPTVAPSTVLLITSFLFSVSSSFWRFFCALQTNTNTNTTTSHYTIFFQYFLLVFYVLNISNRVKNWN